jgi:hypothetical protein
MPDLKDKSQPPTTNLLWPTDWTPAQNQLATEHQSWLQQNCTKGLRDGIDKLERKMVEFMSEHSTDASMTDFEIRIRAAQLKQINALKKIIYDTPTFVNALTKQ